MRSANESASAARAQVVHACGVPQPPPPEQIVIAIAGAVGTELEQVSLELQRALRPYEIETAEISLSAALRDIPGNEGLPEGPYDERVWEYMNAGNALREAWGRGDALALLAIRELAARRVGGPDRSAFVLRSIKHPDEVATLRAVYGSRFFLVSAYRPRETRLAAVRRLIEDSGPLVDPGDWAYGPEPLLERDEYEAGEHGQQLREAFHLADFFIDAYDRERMRPQLERFVALIFGARSGRPAARSTRLPAPRPRLCGQPSSAAKSAPA